MGSQTAACRLNVQNTLRSAGPVIADNCRTMTDWEARCAELEDKSRRLAEAVKLQKEQWEKHLADALQEADKWKSMCSQLEVRLKDKEDQLRQAQKQIEAFRVLMEVKPEDDLQKRVQELEAQLAAQASGLKLAMKENDEQIQRLKDINQEQLIQIRVLEQKLKDMESQLLLANERAFTAEARLGRLQKSHRELMAERNKLALRSSASSGTVATSDAPSEDTSEPISLDDSLAELDAIQGELSAGANGLDELLLNDNQLNQPKDVDTNKKQANGTTDNAVKETQVKANPNSSEASAAKKPPGKRLNWDELNTLLESTQNSDLPSAPKAAAKPGGRRINWDEIDSMLQQM